MDPNERAGMGVAAPLPCGGELVVDRGQAERVVAVAGALAEMGVRSEERVLIMLPDGPVSSGHSSACCVGAGCRCR